MHIVPAIVGLLPIIVINASYVIALVAEKLPVCIPYLSGCTSISATGRYPPSSYLFKAGMIPAAVVLSVFWFLSMVWLRSLRTGCEQPATGGKAICGLGIVGAFLLILYITFLGSNEPFYGFMRRFGVYGYFLFTILAQLFLAIAVLKLPTTTGYLQSVTRLQLLTVVIPLLLGALSLILKNLRVESDSIENALEWIVSLLMQVYFVLAFFAWRRTGFEARFSIR